MSASPYTVELYKLEVDGNALYTGKPQPNEIFVAVKKAREAGARSLQVWVAKEDVVFGQLLLIAGFQGQNIPGNEMMLWKRQFIVLEPAKEDVATGEVAPDGTATVAGQRNVQTFAAPTGPIPATDERIRRLHPVGTA